MRATRAASSESWLATGFPSSMSAAESIRVTAHGIHTAHAPTALSIGSSRSTHSTRPTVRPARATAAANQTGCGSAGRASTSATVVPDSAAAPIGSRRGWLPGRWARSSRPAQIPTASAVAAVVTTAPGRAARSRAEEAVAAALMNSPNAPTVLSSSCWPDQGPVPSEAASIATLVRAGAAMAAAVQAAESVALATAATTQPDATSNPAQPSQLHACSPNRRLSRSSATPRAPSATAGYSVGSVTQRSGSSPSMGAAMRSTAASPAATTARASAVPASRVRRRIARAPTPAVAVSISTTCPIAPRRSHTTAANTAPAMTSSSAPMPRRIVCALGAPRGAGRGGVQGAARGIGGGAPPGAPTPGGLQIA